MSLIKREKFDKYSLSDCQVMLTHFDKNLEGFKKILKKLKKKKNKDHDEIDSVEMDIDCYEELSKDMDNYIFNRISRILEDGVVVELYKAR